MRSGAGAPSGGVHSSGRARRDQQPRDADVIGAGLGVTASFDRPYERRRREHPVQRVDVGAEFQQHAHRFDVSAHRRAMEGVTPSLSFAFGSNPHASIVSSTAALPLSAGDAA